MPALHSVMYINMNPGLGTCAQPVGRSVLNLYPNLISSYISLSIWQMLGYSPPSFVLQSVLTSLSDDLKKADVIIYM